MTTETSVPDVAIETENSIRPELDGGVPGHGESETRVSDEAAAASADMHPDSAAQDWTALQRKALDFLREHPGSALLAAGCVGIALVLVARGFTRQR